MSRIQRVIRDIDVTRPTTPTGLSGTPASETQINLSWNAASDPQGAPSEAQSGVAGYRLYRNGSLRIDQVGTSFNDTGLTAFTQYSYRVTAYDAAGNESIQSSAIAPRTLDTTAPSAPAISATATSSSAITITLTSASTDAGAGVSSYTLQRATDSGFTANLTTTSGLTSGSFPLSVSGLSTATQYFFRLRAVDGASNTGSFSATANATTQGAPSLTLLEADWQARIGGGAVVWLHDFRTVDEVNAFRWTPSFGSGNDPLAVGGSLAPLVRRITTDGITGACLEIVRPAGSADGSVWWRPFSPIQGGTTTGNGRGAGQNDPGASGLSTPITAKAYSPTSGGGQIAQWTGGGWYGTDTSGPGGSGEFDGTDYWLQVRVKMDPNRIAGGNAAEDVGKLFYFTRNDRSATDQEIVTFSGHAISSRNYFSMYRSVSPSLASDPPGVSVHGDQPGTAFGTVGDGVCRFDNNGGRRANCWAWPATEQWVTLLYHVRNGTNGSNNTLVQVFVAEEGATQYTKIWDQPGVDLPFDSSFPFGHNALICSIYHNGDSMPVQFYHRYCQMAFSKDFIPCPQVYGSTGSALAVASYNLASNASVTFSAGSGMSMDEADMAWQSQFFYDTFNNLIQVFGKRANNDTAWKLRTYNVSTGTWTVNDPGGATINRSGHMYGIATMDPLTGDLYIVPGASPSDRTLYRFRPTSSGGGTWSVITSSLWSGALNMPADGLGWHPHLYGANSGGLITSAETSGTSQTAAIVKASNSAVQNVSVGSFDPGRFYGQGVYFPKINKVVFGGASHLHVNATTANGTPTFTAVGAPPIPTKGDTMENTGFGTMMLHPGNPQKMILLERGGSRRFWTSTDGDSWALQSGSHPFTAPAYALCSCAPLGTVWMLGASNTTVASTLWKPPV